MAHPLKTFHIILFFELLHFDRTAEDSIRRTITSELTLSEYNNNSPIPKITIPVRSGSMPKPESEKIWLPELLDARDFIFIGILPIPGKRLYLPHGRGITLVKEIVRFYRFWGLHDDWFTSIELTFLT